MAKKNTTTATVNTVNTTTTQKENTVKKTWTLKSGETFEYTTLAELRETLALVKELGLETESTPTQPVTPQAVATQPTTKPAVKVENTLLHRGIAKVAFGAGWLEAKTRNEAAPKTAQGLGIACAKTGSGLSRWGQGLKAWSAAHTRS